jgi:hypothetical protein
MGRVPVYCFRIAVAMDQPFGAMRFCMLSETGHSMTENRPLAEYPLIVVEWIDASRISDGWIDIYDLPDPVPHRCVSVGFLVAENENGKILISTIADLQHPENHHAYGGMLIPGAAIISARRLL